MFQLPNSMAVQLFIKQANNHQSDVLSLHHQAISNVKSLSNLPCINLAKSKMELVHFAQKLASSTCLSSLDTNLVLYRGFSNRERLYPTLSHRASFLASGNSMRPTNASQYILTICPGRA
uniref:Uncharacterized protein n=1 Tax=Cacopsylla melanoneura TaxID=428564 RepID=A0A8D8LYD5_9HEMI